MKKKPKAKLSLTLPVDVLAFYKQVAKFAGCTTETSILVVLAIETIKLTKENP